MFLKSFILFLFPFLQWLEKLSAHVSKHLDGSASAEVFGDSHSLSKRLMIFNKLCVNCEMQDIPTIETQQFANCDVYNCDIVEASSLQCPFLWSSFIWAVRIILITLH